MIAFLGLGAMGLPMALNLQRKGFAVTGWNRSPGKGDRLIELGGRVAPSIQEAVAEADVVVTMLADPPAVEAVALGDDGFIKHARPGTLWIDASTIGPTAAQQLAEAAEMFGLQFVDAPVLGSIGPAAEGTLHFLTGGTDEAVAKARPLLEAMGAKITHFGPAGAGAAAKIVSNMVTATVLTALAEGLALGERLGLDLPLLAATLAGGPVGSPIVAGKAPAMVKGEFPPNFQLKLMEKDIALALTEACYLGAALPAASAAHTAYAGARAAGMGELDFGAVGAHIRNLSKGPMAKEKVP